MKGYEAIARQLHAASVSQIYTYLAEDILALVSEIDEDYGADIQIVHSRHEQAALSMADGASRTSEEIGVCVIGRGPAICQTGASLGTIGNNSSDVLIVTSASPTDSTYDTKECQQEAYLRAMGCDVVTARSPKTVMHQFAQSLRKVEVGDGPVAIQLPWDLLDGPVDVDVTAGEHPTTRSVSELPAEPESMLHDTVTRLGTRLEPDPDDIDRLVDLYLDSDATQIPVIIAGDGAVRADAKAEIEALAEQMSALLATSLQAQGLFADHPYSLGLVGDWGGTLANEYLGESNFVLAIGCSLNPHTLDSGRLVDDRATLVHVDIDPETFERHTSIDLGIMGDARATVGAIRRALQELDVDREGELWTEDVRTEIAKFSALDERSFPQHPDRVDPRDAVRAFESALPEDRIVVVDGGHFTRYIVDGISITDPDGFVWPLDFGSIGQALPVGIGAATAQPDRTCVTFCGDGGFLMVLQEVETAVRADVPILIVVMNDDALGSEYHNLKNAGMHSSVALLETPDIAAVAESLGADGYTVRSSKDIDSIADSIGDKPGGPVVIDCKINIDVQHRTK